MAFEVFKTKSSDKKGKERKFKRKNKSDLGSNFVAPDGGWGWLVCIATGCSNLVAFPVLQLFGLIFRDRFINIGLSNSEITTVINTHLAVSAFTGLLNGAIFRRFSYRQVALFASILIILGIYLTSVAHSFIAFILTFSVLNGAGIGISVSASALALNTYFKEKRRKATGFSWAITGMGPIVMPYIVTTFLDFYGVHGTILLISGIAIHGIPSALIYQPVLWHVKKEPCVKPAESKNLNLDFTCTQCQLPRRKSRSIFSSQYLHNVDDRDNPGYEIVDPGTPMMPHANDGWFSKKPDKFGSKVSLTSVKTVHRTRRTSNSITAMKFPLKETEINNINETAQKSNNAEVQNELERCQEAKVLDMEEQKLDDTTSFKSKENLKCTCQEEKEKMLNVESLEEGKIEEDEQAKSKKTFVEKLIIFFDLDLLKDLTYVNLMFGLILANIAELNFSILTPFILSDFGYTQDQIALVLSILGGTDLCVRFLIPFFAEKIALDNRTLFAIGIMGIAIGRIIIAHVRSYVVILIVFAWIGMNKALRTIFATLIIPSHVPLNRLPAATGLQLLFRGIICTSVGPLIGLIRDNTDYVVTLHVFNIATFTTITAWSLEKLYKSRKKRK